MGEMSFTGPVGWVGGAGLGSRGGQPALYKYNMADLATHHTHKQNSHCEGKQKKRKSGGEGVPREGRKAGRGGVFSSVQCVDHRVEWLPGTEAGVLTFAKRHKPRLL